MDSAELTGWLALLQVHRFEDEQAAEHAKHVAESGDGEVIYYGRRPDEDDEEPDGPPEQ